MQLNNHTRREKRANVQKEARGSTSPYHMLSAVSKSIRGMPGRDVPKKDVVHCEKLR